MGTRAEVSWSICSAGQAKLASPTSALRAASADEEYALGGYALGGYSAAIAAARAADTPSTAAMLAW